jgi:tRNA1(Val) A37 N6-methylase TrmN6
MDAVLLAAAAPVRAGARVVDLGAGVGTVGLCIAVRVPDARIVLVERDADMARYAADNITSHALDVRVSVVVADVTAPLGRQESIAAHLGTADVVVANPPYALTTQGTRSPDEKRDAAHAMDRDALDAWVRAMAAFGHGQAVAVMIHRAEALPRILAAFTPRFGAITVLPIASAAGETARRVIVTGTKGSGAPLRLLPPLVIHGDDGRATPQVDAILRDGAVI